MGENSMLLNVSLASLKHRRVTAGLTILAIMVSVFVYLSVEHVRTQAKASFSRTVSGVDLIVGPRTGPLNLLLASVFRLGAVPNAIDGHDIEWLTTHPMVNWSIPLALGDSHRGYRVLGTTDAYFQHYKFGDKQPLTFAKGHPFVQDNELVLGQDVAAKLGYKLGDELVLSHGVGKTSFSHHDNFPFKIVGILARTGTPIDHTLHVSLRGLHLMHEGANAHQSDSSTQEHSHVHGEEHLHDQHHINKEEKTTALLLGLKAKYATLMLQQKINSNKEAPLLAIIPGVTLTELWRLMSSVEALLLIISVLVLLAALLGMATMLLASMRERKREVAILRAMGARPGFIFFLIQMEVLLLTSVATLLAYALLFSSLSIAKPWLASQYGVFIDANISWPLMLETSGTILITALFVGLLPAVSAYYRSLNTGLSD